MISQYVRYRECLCFALPTMRHQPPSSRPSGGAHGVPCSRICEPTSFIPCNCSRSLVCVVAARDVLQCVDSSFELLNGSSHVEQHRVGPVVPVAGICGLVGEAGLVAFTESIGVAVSVAFVEIAPLVVFRVIGRVMIVFKGAICLLLAYFQLEKWPDEGAACDQANMSAGYMLKRKQSQVLLGGVVCDAQLALPLTFLAGKCRHGRRNRDASQLFC